MFSLLTSLGKFIFSERDTELSLNRLDFSQINSLYSPGSFNSFIYLTSYQDPVVKAAIKENKFHNNEKASAVLGSWLNLWTKHQIDNTLYLPIPLSNKRKRARGYNQVERIIKAINPSLQINTGLLRRNKHTKPQVELGREERLNNLKNVFSFCSTEINLNDYQQIVIVDDVVTTGTTLNEARATLAPHLPPHIKITCLAIAH
jgi:ComF family protein